MTPAEIIASARFILNDRDDGQVAPRQTDPELLGYVNDGIREVATARPDLFLTIGDMPCIAGRCEQATTFADVVRLVEVLSIHGGQALTLFDRRTMDAFRPGWRMDPAGAARQWSPMEEDQLRFFVYPPAPPGQVLDVRYVRLPASVGLADAIKDLPENLQPALVDYVVHRAESKDDEHVLSARSAAFLASFRVKIGVSNGAAASE